MPKRTYELSVDPDEPVVYIEQTDDGIHTVVLTSESEIAKLMSDLQEALATIMSRSRARQ